MRTQLMQDGSSAREEVWGEQLTIWRFSATAPLSSTAKHVPERKSASSCFKSVEITI